MFSPRNRLEIRKMYHSCWEKYKDKKNLQPLEKQIIRVILEHPEYQGILENSDESLEKEFTPEMGETNPFLHMGLHLAIREQVSTNRPKGISKVFEKLAKKYSVEKAEHLIMDCLIESIWQSQKYGTPPDEKSYFENVKRL